MQVAVVGAGLAGTAAARILASAGHDVVIYEKSRGVGGRTASRRAGDLRFDHGAATLHDGPAPLRDEQGCASCQLLHDTGAAAAEVVGLPAASGVAKDLARGLAVHTGVRVEQLRRVGARWQLTRDVGAELGWCDAVIVTAPAPQTAELLQDASPMLAAHAASVPYAACWSVMAAWAEPLDLPWSISRGVADLSLALAEHAKPGRPAVEAWVLQADPDFSAAHLEESPERVQVELLDRLAALAGRELPEPAHVAAHRWRYARPLMPLGQQMLADGSLLVAGDWCGGTTAGDALRSGRSAALALLGSIATAD